MIDLYYPNSEFMINTENQKCNFYLKFLGCPAFHISNISSIRLNIILVFNLSENDFLKNFEIFGSQKTNKRGPNFQQ